MSGTPTTGADDDLRTSVVSARLAAGLAQLQRLMRFLRHPRYGILAEREVVRDARRLARITGVIVDVRVGVGAFVVVVVLLFVAFVVPLLIDERSCSMLFVSHSLLFSSLLLLILFSSLLFSAPSLLFSSLLFTPPEGGLLPPYGRSWGGVDGAKMRCVACPLGRPSARCPEARRGATRRGSSGGGAAAAARATHAREQRAEQPPRREVC